MLLLRPWMAARNRKATAGWVTTKMNNNLFRGRKSGTSDCELRAETEAATQCR